MDITGSSRPVSYTHLDVYKRQDVRTVAGRLGHTDPSLTLRTYTHVIEERDRAAAAILGRVLGASPATSVVLPESCLLYTS